MATDELAAASEKAGDSLAAATGFSFSIWPPTQRTREAVVRRLVDTLAADTLLCKRYGAVPAADADPAARAIEADAFAAAAGSGAAASSVEDGIEALQLYSKEVSRRLLDFVKSRSTAAAKTATAPEEAVAAATPADEASEPQPAA